MLTINGDREGTVDRIAGVVSEGVWDDGDSKGEFVTRVVVVDGDDVDEVVGGGGRHPGHRGGGSAGRKRDRDVLGAALDHGIDVVQFWRGNEQ